MHRGGNPFSEKRQGKELCNISLFGVKMNENCSYWEGEQHVNNNFKKAILAVEGRLNVQSVSSF